MIAQHVVHFARALRDAGMAIGPDRVLVALAAIDHVGLCRRDDVHAALSTAMLDRHEQQLLFDLTFERFWGGNGAWAPAHLAPMSAAPQPVPRRLAPQPAGSVPQAELADTPATIHSRLGHSERERLQRADFETMTTAEFALAKKLAEELPLPVEPVRRRRQEAASRSQPGGRLDLRATLQRMARQPHTLMPRYTRPRQELPALVVLLDISGSMERYSRLMLHYIHGLMRRALRVSTLTFGTRLTPITRCLQERDPDAALSRVDAAVADWKGGTRIASALQRFNQVWARRLLGGNAAVLLVTDGLDRDDVGDLGAAATQLHRLAHQVVWLNPLLRFDGFEPRARGVRALLPHVDRFLPVHNLASLADLGRALRVPVQRSLAKHQE